VRVQALARESPLITPLRTTSGKDLERSTARWIVMWRVERPLC